VNEDAFAAVRALLFTVAYDVLGSAAEAEDVVQDAWLRWSSADRGDVRDPKAYLVLPEPVLTSPDVADEVEVAEAVSLALLVVLETLSPLERAVFVLREVFGFSHAEIGETLGRSEASVRQLAHRAREHVEARRPRFATDRRMRREVTERFLAATVDGDVEALVATMAPGVTLVTDGGGRAKAALRPIVGPRKVAAFLAAVTGEGLAAPDLRLEVVDVNGAPAVAARAGDGVFVVVQLQVGTSGLVEQIHVVLNPEKLAGVAAPWKIAVR
jgi:DNA-directed RNA polymerase specialized sigma24 family protein